MKYLLKDRFAYWIVYFICVYVPILLTIIITLCPIIIYLWYGLSHYMTNTEWIGAGLLTFIINFLWFGFLLAILNRYDIIEELTISTKKYFQDARNNKE